MPDTASLGRGVFTLSLDFELIWGTLDRNGPSQYRRMCELERELVLDRLLALLTEFDISATWCIVGHLLLSSCARADGIVHPEIVRPNHRWVDGDWFQHDPCGDEHSDPIFYGASLVEKIKGCAVPQEVGCHSFSHVIFGDDGCSRPTATTEVAECLKLASERGLVLQSFAFPRNQVGHLDVLAEKGFTCYRGSAPVWYARPRVPSPVTRLAHLIDVVVAREPPVALPQLTPHGVWNVPASMMYFPMHGKRRYLPVRLRVSRAWKGLERASTERKVFHLWFHPTNLAEESTRMFAGLRQIFGRVNALREAGAIEVAPMGALVPSHTYEPRAS